jgi:four helix bundle protein
VSEGETSDRRGDFKPVSEVHGKENGSREMALSSYRELQSWQVGMEVIESIYGLTKTWPAHERFGLVSQAQRASVSIAANIAEGYGRLHRGDYVHHLSIANGSRCELETLLLIAERVRVAAPGSTARSQELSARVGQMLTKQIQTLRPPG